MAYIFMFINAFFETVNTVPNLHWMSENASNISRGHFSYKKIPLILSAFVLFTLFLICNIGDRCNRSPYSANPNIDSEQAPQEGVSEDTETQEEEKDTEPSTPNNTLLANRYINKDKYTAYYQATIDGLKPKIVYDLNESVPKDTVFRQCPAPGSKVSPNEEILLYVSSGPSCVSVKKYVGSAKKQIKIQDGLQVAFAYDENTLIEAGIIIRQSIRFNSKVPRGSLIILTVSAKKSQCKPETLEQIDSNETGNQTQNPNVVLPTETPKPNILIEGTSIEDSVKQTQKDEEPSEVPNQSDESGIDKYNDDSPVVDSSDESIIDDIELLNDDPIPPEETVGSSEETNIPPESVNLDQESKPQESLE